MYDCELVENKFYHWTEPVSRKAYQCCECSAPIQKGERYFKAVARNENGFFTERQHLLCCEACVVVRDEIEMECLPFGMLKDYCHEFRLDHRDAAKKGHEGIKKLRRLLARIKIRERSDK